MSNSLTIKVTRFQRSIANRFRTVAKSLPAGANLPFDSDFGHLLATPLLKVGLRWQPLRSLVTKKYTKQCVIV